MLKTIILLCVFQLVYVYGQSQNSFNYSFKEHSENYYFVEEYDVSEKKATIAVLIKKDHITSLNAYRVRKNEPLGIFKPQFVIRLVLTDLDYSFHIFFSSPETQGDCLDSLNNHLSKKEKLNCPNVINYKFK